MSTFKPIRDLIREGKLKEALSTLADTLSNDINQKRKLDDDAILLNFKLRELERKESLNLVSAELASQEKSQISMATLELLKRLEEVKDIPSIIPPKSASTALNFDALKSKKWMRPAIGVVTALGLIAFIFTGTDLLSNIGLGSGYFFVDHFDSSKLKSSWSIIEESKPKWGFDKNQGRLQLISQPGAIYEKRADLKNQFVLEKKLPNDNYEIVGSFSFQIKEQFNKAAISLFQDDDNYMSLDYRGRPWGYNVRRSFSFLKEQEGKASDIEGPGAKTGKDKAPRNIYFKIERQGNDFISYYSNPAKYVPFEELDKIRWTEVGRHTWISFEGKLSIWATNTGRSINGPTPESTAAFDFICIRAIPKEEEEKDTQTTR